MKDYKCKQCDESIPEWSFICPVCFCKYTDYIYYTDDEILEERRKNEG